MVNYLKPCNKLSMLNFNFDKFDFWEIYLAIKKFYPIGILKDESKMFYSYPGFKKLEAIIVDHIHNDHNFETRWVSFTNEIENQIQKPVIGTTLGQAPSFSSYIQIATFSLDNLTRTKELHFFVSLVGPFYTLIGQDKNVVKVGDRYFRSTNYLIISPMEEYTVIFQRLCDQIENRFPGYRFVPFEIYQQTIQGLDVRYVDENLDTVFNALFNNHIDLRVSTLGNDYYKAEDWIKKGYVDDTSGWTSYPPL